MSKYLYEFLRKDTTFDIAAFIYGFTYSQYNLKKLLSVPYPNLFRGIIFGYISQVFGEFIYDLLPSSLKPAMTMLIMGSVVYKIIHLINGLNVKAETETETENENIILKITLN
jgi:hypothetical protein